MKSFNPAQDVPCHPESIPMREKLSAQGDLASKNNFDFTSRLNFFCQKFIYNSVLRETHDWILLLNCFNKGPNSCQINLKICSHLVFNQIYSDFMTKLYYLYTFRAEFTALNGRPLNVSLKRFFFVFHWNSLWRFNISTHW